MQIRLENNIKDSYESGVTLLQAEKLAGEFLHGQLIVSTELTKLDLDTRMRKSGVRAIRASVYMVESGKDTKKPTEAMLTAVLDSNSDVLEQQAELDEVESQRDELKRLLDVYSNAHIHFRTICKGGFGG